MLRVIRSNEAPPLQRRTGLNRARLAGVQAAAYRFRIGIVEAAIVSDGPLTLPAASTIFAGVPETELEAALRDAFLPPGQIRVEQNCVLLDLGGHLVLIDNGMGSSQIFGAEAGHLTDSLAPAGVAPDQIDSLVLTHAHSDHCWGTMRDDGTPAFANAQIYLPEPEWAYWTGPRRDDVGLSATGFRKHLLPLQERIVLIRDGDEFLPGLHALASPGHTPGHFSILIASADEQCCLLGDVAFHHILSFAMPDAQSAYDTDRAQGVATRLRLLEALADERMRVLNYHAPWPGIGYVRRDGRAFRWCPESLDFAATPRSPATPPR